MNSIVKVFLVSSGLGNVKRGYESFTRECFDAIRLDPSLDITLFKGNGNHSEKEIVLWNLPRHAKFTLILGRLFERSLGRDTYWLEQSTFGFSLLPYLYLNKPDVVYFSDENLGNLLWYWRYLTKQSYKLLFSNGGPISPPFDRWDHVQQLAPVHLNTAIQFGEPASKLSLVPYGIDLTPELEILSPPQKEAVRDKLGLPRQREVLLSVGTINKSHKRMNYVIREVSSLPKPRPYLMLLGQLDHESAEIAQLAQQLLGPQNFQIRTLPQNEVKEYYQVVDAFVLASFSEGLPRVCLEAMAYGLPCLAHDYPVMRFVLGSEGNFANFELGGQLAQLIPSALAESGDFSKRHQRHQYIYNKFSWQKLKPDYIKLIHLCANV